MPTLESAKEKWQRKTAGKGQRWQNATKGKKGDYKKGVAKFLGVSEGDIGDVAENWDNEISQSKAVDNYNSGVSGKADDWANNYKRKMQLKG